MNILLDILVQFDGLTPRRGLRPTTMVVHCFFPATTDAIHSGAAAPAANRVRDKSALSLIPLRLRLFTRLAEPTAGGGEPVVQGADKNDPPCSSCCYSPSHSRPRSSPFSETFSISSSTVRCLVDGPLVVVAMQAIGLYREQQSLYVLRWDHR